MIADSAMWAGAISSSESAFKTFHQNDLQQCYRLLLRGSSCWTSIFMHALPLRCLNGLRILKSKSRAARFLRGSFSHQDIADVVGASRPRVTEHLAQLEREHLIIR
jgi:hypothetical protein